MLFTTSRYPRIVTVCQTVHWGLLQQARLYIGPCYNRPDCTLELLTTGQTVHWGLLQQARLHWGLLQQARLYIGACYNRPDCTFELLTTGQTVPWSFLQQARLYLGDFYTHCQELSQHCLLKLLENNNKVIVLAI
ncbi:hypothetical protein BsWGS_27434 [Bradybaena similaris]